MSEVTEARDKFSDTHPGYSINIALAWVVGFTSVGKQDVAYNAEVYDRDGHKIGQTANLPLPMVMDGADAIVREHLASEAS